uniref:Uncharacterized protein n=1 Tax=Lepeophtheirus salmonis TaxID=72036 RepID=A0A0K2UK91_LEPSM
MNPILLKLIIVFSILTTSYSRIGDNDRWTKTMIKICQWQLNKTQDDNRRVHVLVEEKYFDMMNIFNKFVTHLFVNATYEEEKLMNQTVYQDVLRLRGAHDIFKKFLSSPSDHHTNRYREYDDTEDETKDSKILPTDFFLIATQIDIKPFIYTTNVTFNGIIRKFCSVEKFEAETCLTLLYLRAQSSVIKFYAYHKMYSMIQDTPSTLRNFILNSLKEMKKKDRAIFTEIFGGKFDKRYGCHLSCPYVGVSTPQSKPQDELIQRIVNSTNGSHNGVLDLKSIGFTSNFIVSHAFLSNYDLIPSCHKKCVETYNPTAVLLFDTKDGEVKFDNETRNKCNQNGNQIILKYAHGFKIDTTFVTGGYVDNNILLCHTGGWKLGECVMYWTVECLLKRN